ncbi:hypothetical protein [Bacillus sp. FJAT-27231]|uniref:hypothetical protein n=1 Tax=Bacillus sp. FJAT-27231 TaxID=1679168 RepID=UPI000AA6D556|nr:hypothetical protein [Bacillus sp. FJAT-27231]
MIRKRNNEQNPQNRERELGFDNLNVEFSMEDDVRFLNGYNNENNRNPQNCNDQNC